MDLSGIVLIVLIILLGLGLAAGVVVLVTSKGSEREQADRQLEWLEEAADGELPPPVNAWKPATWYSEAADGTLFPNQPSPNFRILPDSSFQRAIARRDREDRAADEPTEPHASIPGRVTHALISAPLEEMPIPSIPDELEVFTQIPTISMPIVPVQDNLAPTLKMRSQRRESRRNPLPETGSSMDLGERVIPSPIFPEPELPPEVTEPIASEPEPLHEQNVMVPADHDDKAMELGETNPVGWFDSGDWPDTSLITSPAEEIEALTTIQDTLQDTLPTTMATQMAEEDAVILAQVEATWAAEDSILPNEIRNDSLASQPDRYTETEEQRHDLLMIDVYNAVIHLRYNAELDAIVVSFADCSVNKSLDVPWVFKTISLKIQELFLTGTWHQYALLLDVAGLKVSREAEAAWEMVLDGFVSQSCPEIAPNIVLAVQYDSSVLHQAIAVNEGGDEALLEKFQHLESFTGQPRPLALADSFEAAVRLLQQMRAGIASG